MYQASLGKKQVLLYSQVSNRVQKPIAYKQKQSVSTRKFTSSRKVSVVVKAGLFDIFSAKPKVDTEVLDELIQISSRTNKGYNANKQTKEKIEELIDEVAKYCPRGPAKSNLLYGVWTPIYAEQPSVLASPLSGGPPGIALGGKQFYTTINPDKSYENLVQFKTLGLIGGFASEEGQLKVTGGDTYSVEFFVRKEQVFGGVKEVEIEDKIFKFKVLYLDDDYLITYLIDEENDTTVDLIFSRVTEDEDEDEDEEVEDEEEEEYEDEEEDEQPQGGLKLPFGRPQKQEGIVTQAEKQLKAAQSKALETPQKINSSIQNVEEQIKDVQADSKATSKSLREQDKLAQSATKDANQLRQRQQKLKGQLQDIQDQLQATKQQEKDIKLELREAEALIAEYS